MADNGKFILCPYCGHAQRGANSERCEECGGYFEPLSRRATQISMGPWYIRDKKNPFRPGCSYQVMVKQAKAGRIKTNTVIRGPSTRQYWSVARNVPGIAHVLGYCHRCGAHVKASDKQCHECSEPFTEVKERNELGLLYSTEREAEAARRALERERMGGEATDITVARPESSRAARSSSAVASGGRSGDDLLDQVLGVGPESSTSTKPSKKRDSEGSRMLQFDSDDDDKPRRQPDADQAKPAPSGAAASAASPAPLHSLDFTPSDDSEGNDYPAPPAQGQSMLTWVLLIVNLVALIAVIVALFIFMQSRDEDAETSANYLPPIPIAQAGRDANVLVNDRNPADAAANAQATSVLGTPIEDDPLFGAGLDSDLERLEAEITRDSLTPTDGTADRSDGTQRAGVSSSTPRPIDGMAFYDPAFVNASEYESQGQFEHALSILRQIRAASRDEAVLARVERETQRIEQRMEAARRERGFFGIDIDD